MNSPYSIYRVNWEAAAPHVRTVREQVFIREQLIPASLEWDKLDPLCLHLQVIIPSGQTVATARIQSNGQIGRMAVLAQWRGQGIGTAMVQDLLEYCQAYGLHAHLNAQSEALGFYRRLGFRAIGDEYLDAGIPHQHMEYHAS